MTASWQSPQIVIQIIKNNVPSVGSIVLHCHGNSMKKQFLSLIYTILSYIYRQMQVREFDEDFD